MRLRQPAGQPLFPVSGPSPPTLVPPQQQRPEQLRRRTAYRELRQVDRLLAVQVDGAAYAHIRSVLAFRDSTPRRPVEGGTTRHTIVDKRRAPLQYGCPQH